jgi:hypothetical protein
MDARVVGIVDKFFRLVLMDELETIIGRHLECLVQRLMNVIRDRPDLVLGFASEQ